MLSMAIPPRVDAVLLSLSKIKFLLLLLLLCRFCDDIFPKPNKYSSCCSEGADLTATSEISVHCVQHADDDYSRRGNFGGLQYVFSVLTRWHQCVCGSRDGEFYRIGSV